MKAVKNQVRGQVWNEVRVGQRINIYTRNENTEWEDMFK